MKTTVCLLLVLVLALPVLPPLSPITTRSVPPFSAASRFSHGRLLHCYGETKVTAEELLVRAGSNGYQGGLTERKTALEMARDT
jgi:hypothetical protein